MNLISQFIEENFHPVLHHHSLEQTQIIHSALEQLLTNLQTLKSKDIFQLIKTKSTQLQIYLTLRSEVMSQLKSQSNSINNNNSAIFQWILHYFESNPILFQLINKQKNLIQKILLTIGKRNILQPSYQLNYIQEKQLGYRLLEQLNIIMKKNDNGIINGISTGSNYSQGNQKILNRQKIKQLDESFQNLNRKIQLFSHKIGILVKRIFSFEDKISFMFCQDIKQINEQRQYIEFQQDNQLIQKPYIQGNYKINQQQQYIPTPQSFQYAQHDQEQMIMIPRKSSAHNSPKNSRKSSFEFQINSNMYHTQKSLSRMNQPRFIKEFTPKKKLLQTNQIFQEFYENNRKKATQSMNNKKPLKIGQQPEQYHGGEKKQNIKMQTYGNGTNKSEFYRKMAHDLRGGKTSQLKLSDKANDVRNVPRMMMNEAVRYGQKTHDSGFGRGMMMGTYANFRDYNHNMNVTNHTHLDNNNKYDNQFSFTQQPQNIKWANITKPRNQVNNYY